jgi:hypothetical protein
MKIAALLIAILLCWTALMPTAPGVPAIADETPALNTLDVCHSAAGSMSIDMPYLLICPCRQLPLLFAGMQPVFLASSKPLLLAFQDERPPEHLL